MIAEATGGLFDRDPPEHEADPLDVASRAEAQWLEDKLREQAERAKPRFVALDFGGVPHCAECQRPLKSHRVEAGICVPCLTVIEKQEQQYRRR